MRTFLSRITSTVRRNSTGGGDAQRKGTSGGSARAGRTRAGGGAEKSAGVTSRPGARSKRASASRSKPAAKAKPVPQSKPAGRRQPAGKTKPAGRTKPAGSGKSSEKAAEQPAEGRRSPSPVVRALAMLLAFGAMVAFAGVLSRLTLEPSAASASIAHTNLQPGASIRAYLSQPAFQDTVKQLGGNIVLGIPFGVLLPVLIPRARGFLRVTLATAMVMLMVELVQGALINGRAFDVDDVILNSTGAFLGYLLLGRRLGRAVHPPRRRWWQRRLSEPVAD